MPLPDADAPEALPPRRRRPSREQRRQRRRWRRRRAYIRSVYFLPSLATLGNAICGFATIYVGAFGAGLPPGGDPVSEWLAGHAFSAAAGFVFAAMVFDALDGRLARFARHTTDFGGQLDSLADVISFGAAPALLALYVFKIDGPPVPFVLGRLIWAVGAIYASCAAIRLARFNVSNEHGEQHHFSFLGLPSPGAGGAVAAFILMEQAIKSAGLHRLAVACAGVLPVLVLGTGLLMISNVRYPHIVNRYLRGRRSIGRLVAAVAVVLCLVLAPQFTLAIGLLIYALWGPTWVGWAKLRRRAGANPARA